MVHHPTPWGNPTGWPPVTLASWNYFRWNGAWGYLKFDDLGLYYAHGRWYNPDTGMWLSPNNSGDYKYNRGQNPTSKAWFPAGLFQISSAQQNQTGRYIYTNYGAVIDTDHFHPDVIRQNLLDPLSAGRPEIRLRGNLCGGIPLNFCNNLWIDVTYHVTHPSGDRNGVGLAIWMDYQMKFETAQPSLPLPGGSSVFSIEDLPTDYLAFYAAASGNNLDDIIGMLGGIRERSDREPPHCPGWEPECPYQNRQFTPRIEEIEILRPPIRIGPWEFGG